MMARIQPDTIGVNISKQISVPSLSLYSCRVGAENIACSLVSDSDLLGKWRSETCSSSASGLCDKNIHSYTDSHARIQRFVS